MTNKTKYSAAWLYLHKKITRAQYDAYRNLHRTENKNKSRYSAAWLYLHKKITRAQYDAYRNLHRR